ncbi:hypothetical protein ACBZ91_02595 [Vibrio natriegens]|uniref:hypothetical protein n=1 Tax=Vibrio natriegens TaxID=691 RepID=UPI00355606CF
MTNAAYTLESAFNYKRWDKFAKQQQDYMEHVVKPLFDNHDWEAIKQLPVLVDKSGKALIKFGDDIWALKEHLVASDYNLSKLLNLHFFAYDYSGIQVDIGARLPTQLGLEVKLFAYYCLFLAPKIGERILSVRSVVNPLKALAMECSEYGLTSLQEVNRETLRRMINLGYVQIQQKTITSLNSLTKAYELPLEFEDRGTFTTNEFPNLFERDGEQNQVIPLAVYKTLFDQAESVVNKYYGSRAEIQEKLRDVQAKQRAAQTKIQKAIRTGSCSINAYFRPPVEKELIERFSEAGVELVDDFREGEKWVKLIEEIDPSYKSLNIRDHTTARMTEKGYDLFTNEFYWKNLSAFKDTLYEIDAACRFLIQALSGMRTDELWRIRPEFGLQHTTIKGTVVPLLTTRQSKISLNANTVNDVYVTTQMGAKAYRLLNDIHAPLRENFKTGKNRFFGGFRGLLKTTPADKDTDNLNKYVKLWLKDYELTEEDLSQLDMSNPDRTTNKKAGVAFKFNPHQLRRSLAFYLIGYELLSYPQLKQQFSHFTVAMTRWYARYASSFARMHREIEEERVNQKAQIMARIHKKLVNGERLGGGKVTEITKNMSKQGDSEFEEGSEDRVVSVDYWKRRILSGIEHIHAIAPNMYCTHRSCSMRTSIDLSDCVDCGFDIFEFASYAESVRKEAEIALHLADELDELNPPTVARQVVQIRSAEKLMADMGVPFDPVEIPKGWEEMILHWEAA